MYVSFDDAGRLNGCRVLRLESDLLRLDILPALGGKIYRWTYKPTGRDFLWQHPLIGPRILPAGSNYDDHWSGGWDELFPNCVAGRHGGESYPDHGEYWTAPFEWRAERSADCVTLYLGCDGPVTPTRMQRWICLTAGAPAVRIRYRLTHLGRHPFDYLWTLHPAFAINPSSRLEIPAGQGVIAAPGQGRLAERPLAFTWPQVPARDGGRLDFRTMPESTPPGYEMVYLTELHAGWFAVRDTTSRCGFGLAFDRGLFNTLWVFRSHGGWRGLHVVNIKPSSGYPADLDAAASGGRCARLLPGQCVETELTAVAFERDRVRDIGRDGTVE